MTNTESFVAKARAVHGDKFIYTKTEYLGALRKIIISCRQHGEFEIWPGNHLQGHGCRRCSNGIKSNFIEVVKQQFPGYDLGQLVYTSNKRKVVVICPHHGEFTKRAGDLYRGNGCPKCVVDSRKIGLDQFIARAKELYGDKYTYERSIYTNNHIDITVTCPKHGDIQVKPMTFLKGHECLRCYLDNKVTNTEKFVEAAKRVHGEAFDYSSTNYIVSTQKLEVICNNCGQSFRQLPGNHLQGSCCPFCNLSTETRALGDFVAQFTPIRYNDRTIIAPYEIDIYVPQFHFGIEYNGLRWHTEDMVGKQRHQIKALAAQSQQIKLMQFWEHEWLQKPDLIKSMIVHKLGKSIPYYARKLNLIELRSEETRDFFNSNHLLGYRSAAITLSLIEKKPLLMMSFSSTGKLGEWEIIRIASRQGCVVVGGVSRLFKHFLRRCRPMKVLTYADLRYSTGRVYEQLGFTPMGHTKPGYFYIKGTKVLSRQQCQKHKLHKLLPTFDPVLSESQNMRLNGYYRCWDAGHLRYWLRK